MTSLSLKAAMMQATASVGTKRLPAEISTSDDED